MNIFHKVTLQSLKKNRTRTIVTIVGIVLSTALICAVTTSCASFLNYAREYIIRNHGSWHGYFMNVGEDDTEKIIDSEQVADYAVIREEGYAKLDGILNESKPYIYIASVKRTKDNVINIKITEGKYPENDGEILIPNH
ncbi:MAG: ABC transporter permease, partial [Ruminococcus sp.]|nr:ABC transporter permease [Ruminococcus sp.]